MSLPRLIELNLQPHYRIIPSVYPPINFFENIVNPSEMATLYEIESLTNERLRQEAGDIFLVAKEDWVSGPGSSVIMAAFTHIGRPSRFTDGTFGVYYASLSRLTAIKETVYHRERFLQATRQNTCEISMRLYKGKIIKPLCDITGTQYQSCHHPENYTVPQGMGKALRAQNTWGLLYRSTRHETGRCIATFRPPAVSNPLQLSHLRYVWNGEKITNVLDVNASTVFK